MRSFRRALCILTASIPALIVALIAAPLLPAPAAAACSAFGGTVGGEPAVGKNFDWSDGEGLLVVNPRGRLRRAFLQPEREWTARYGSLALTVLGPGLPVSGMNEAGLVFEALVDQSASASTPDGHGYASLEWGQYVLDRFERVGDALASLKARGIEQLGMPLHFFLCDRTGACAVVESGAKGPRVVEPAALSPRILANRAWGADAAGAQRRLDGNALSRLFSSSQTSAARFATLQDGLRGGALDGDGAAFGLLDKARIRSLNQWQILWRQARPRLAYRLRRAEDDTTKIRRVAFDAVDFACTDQPRVQPLTRADAPAVWRAHSPDDARALARRMTPLLGRRLAELIAEHTASSRCAKDAKLSR
jgi:hypothetical protein